MLNAVCRGDLDVVRRLVQQGHNINEKTRTHDLGALYIAASRGSLDIVQYLVEHGANIERSNKEGASPLRISYQQGYLTVVKFLVEHGANLNKADKEGDMPIDCANNHRAIVEYLHLKMKTKC